MLSVSRPIFVLGTTCSGSTVLSWALAQHPRVAHALETQWLPRLAGELQSLLEAGTADSGASRLVEMSVDRSRFYGAFGEAVNSLFLNLSGRPGNRARRTAPRRWVACTPQHVLQIAGLIRLFPDAQFLHVLRGVRSVVPLLVNSTVPGRPRYTERDAYAYWLETSRGILEAELAFGPQRILRVNYEDLVRDPERTLRTCLRFVNERFCADCVRPLNGLEAGREIPDPAEGDVRCRSRIRREAELLSDLLVGHQTPDAERIARLDAAFTRRSRRRTVQAASLPLVQRVREAARTVLPADARVLVISKGDDDLLELGTRKASHFPQNDEGTYAGHYPATGDDAVAHLEHLRARGHDYLLIPGPYFWWLEHYGELTAHLHTKCRAVYYQEDNCMVFALDRTSQGWAAPLTGGGSGPAIAGGRGGGKTGPRIADRAGLVGVAASRPTKNPPVRRKSPLAQRLWGGFSATALPALEEACASEATPAHERIEAAWELARWFTAREDFDNTRTWLRTIARFDPSQRLRKRHLLLEVRAELRLGNTSQAKSLLAMAAARHGYDTDLCLLWANAFEGPPTPTDPAVDEERLKWINRVLIAHDLHPVRKIDTGLPLALDNITAVAAGPGSPVAGAKVSVVLPAYNADRTIEFALRSVQEQTWKNLEILVVDDASSDNTRAIVATMAAADSRIRLIALEANGGAYVARNAGLAQATGEYFTVHDADDWSHPQMIERQIAHLQAHDVVGTLTRWARTSRGLHFVGSWRPNDRLLDDNFASLMLPIQVVRELGGWDPVRTGADTEFRRRLETKWGRSRVPTIMADVPLSFSLNDEGSLTRQGPTHISTLHFGVRREYHRLYERWHQVAARTGDYRIPTDPAATRVFPAPAPILPSRPTREYDVVFICDFALEGGAFVSPYQYLLAALKQGLRVGVFHWRRYDLSIDRPIDERVAQLIDEFKVDMLVAEQAARTANVVLYYPRLFQYRLDRVPALQFERMHVIVNQMASRFYSGEDPQYDPLVVRDNIETLFGAAGEWFPISPLVRTLMAADARYPPAGDVTWTPLLDTDAWCGRPLQWRGAGRATPVIGRHGRDHYSKWPGDRGLIERAYCVHQGWEARFLGGAEHAIKALGAQPETWKTWPYDGMGVQTFLDGLDFLVHVPHEDYIEEFGRVAMEAMAVGIPVILPQRFAVTFGDAAICCEPDAVADHIADLWRDPERYVARARAGRQFVLDHCSLDQLARRLSLPGSGSASPGGSHG